MSTYGKLGFLMSGFCLIVITGARYILGTWHPLLYGFLAFFLLGLVISIILDHKFYFEFLSMKTTKNGLSLGWSLILLVVLLVVFSYLGHRFNKTFDLTEEGINSLAEQTKDTLKSLEHQATIYIFYKGDKLSQKTLADKQKIKEDLFLYKQGSSKIKILYIDTYKNNLLSERYLADLPDKNQKEIFVFVDYDGKKVRIEEPFTEEKITSALIKVQKRTTQEIYFFVGHGERNLNNSEPSGLKIFNQYLQDSGFVAKEWNFIKDGVPPSTPPLILIAGPRRPFLAAEINWLKKYLSKEKGQLILAIDPKENHNAKDFLLPYGVVFKDNFILSQIGMLYGGYTKALGVIFDSVHPITKRFQSDGQSLVLFERASSLDIAKKQNFKYSYLVQSHNNSFSVPQITKQVAVKNMSSLTMAVEVTAQKEDGFRLVVFGDSDFLSNRYFDDGANKDLILNSIVSLLGEDELITIRPKQPKGTKIVLTRYQRTGIVIFLIILPLAFLVSGLLLWYRRREA